MRLFLAFAIGLALGAAALWFFGTSQGRSTAANTSKQIEETTRAGRDALQERMKSLGLGPDEIREELAKGGAVVRRKAEEAGKAISDATADARTTAAIKSKLLTSRELSALSISVNTTDGVVTLSGSVRSPEEVSKAMLLAMETEGVREVISTLQVKAGAQKTQKAPPP